MTADGERTREHGLTLIELLVVIGILGLLAAVIIPNISGFRTSGNLAAANTEVQNVRTAATGYRSQNDSWPANSGNLTPLLSGTPKGSYIFDPTNGWVTNAAGWTGLVFNPSSQAWERAP
jgi:prepilin-type N-terminal cleavage/methylation domain-containing protein